MKATIIVLFVFIIIAIAFYVLGFRLMRNKTERVITQRAFWSVLPGVLVFAALESQHYLAKLYLESHVELYPNSTVIETDYRPFKKKVTLLIDASAEKEELLQFYADSQNLKQWRLIEEDQFIKDRLFAKGPSSMRISIGNGYPKSTVRYVIDRSKEQ